MLSISNLKKSFQLPGEIFLPVVRIEDFVLEKNEMVAIHGVKWIGENNIFAFDCRTANPG